ncbi:glycosyltransferase family 4 protein [uncultured Sphingomonas sp.]|uniref:glycosyltransferase family 4 protein n=1 Tax=uncultured Sphingomonas sp. TaxID=158754 RepID=UPI003748BEA0
MPDEQPNFCVFYSGDGYSTAAKIMGRQSAGRALVEGIARRWPDAAIAFAAADQKAGAKLDAQLRGAEHRGGTRWRDLAGTGPLHPGAVYYPAVPDIDLVHARNARGTTTYSLFGVTHTLSTDGAMDQVARMILPPFQPWDALVCTSHAALVVVGRLQDELRGWLREHLGATRFVAPVMPVVPLGINAPSFAPREEDRAAARASLDLAADDVTFLFAGRMAFHAKANPVPFYQAVEAACRRTGRVLTVIEAGVYPNKAIADAFAAARATLAPSARFIAVAGEDEAKYRAAWQAADVFVSLSDNIQETFGLTPVEAMAAGLPVLVSDWNGYKDTVRDGIDGYRIPVTLAPAGTGDVFAARHAADRERYDMYIGRAALGTAIDGDVLADRVVALAQDPALRRQLGEAGRRRATQDFDWPVILDRYAELADELAAIRHAAPTARVARPNRPDPFALFSHYPTTTLGMDWTAAPRDANGTALAALLELGVARYGFDREVLPRATVEAVHHRLAKGEQRVADLIAGLPGRREVHVLALMWLVKFGLAAVRA